MASMLNNPNVEEVRSTTDILVSLRNHLSPTFKPKRLFLKGETRENSRLDGTIYNTIHGCGSELRHLSLDWRSLYQPVSPLHPPFTNIVTYTGPAILWPMLWTPSLREAWLLDEAGAILDFAHGLSVDMTPALTTLGVTIDDTDGTGASEFKEFVATVPTIEELHVGLTGGWYPEVCSTLSSPMMTIKTLFVRRNGYRASMSGFLAVFHTYVNSLSLTATTFFSSRNRSKLSFDGVQLA